MLLRRTTLRHLPCPSKYRYQRTMLNLTKRTTQQTYHRLRNWLTRSSVGQHYRNKKSSLQFPKYISSKTGPESRPRKSVLFLCPATNRPHGGVKVIYRQASIIEAAEGPLAAQVLHPFDLQFKCTWFANGATIKRDLMLNSSNDFVMIPEIWAVPHARLLAKLGVRYGIYVQGGYVLGTCGSEGGEEHDAAYLNADLILAISDDTTDCIKMAYPACANKVYRVYYSISPEKFVAHPIKENVVCYMPRRLSKHSKLVMFLLEKKLPSNWSIVSIDGLDEDGVCEILGRSRIFLSFSELEGCPMPPVEAALSGCHVIGYTGEGGKEYWDPELFTEIHSGDIKSFVRNILNKVAELDAFGSVADHSVAIQNLANRYSRSNERLSMQSVSRKILEILSMPRSDCVRAEGNGSMARPRGSDSALHAWPVGQGITALPVPHTVHDQQALADRQTDARHEDSEPLRAA